MKLFPLFPLSMAWASVQASTTRNIMDPSSHHRHRHLLQESSCTLIELCVSKGPDEEDEHSWVCELSREESAVIHADFVNVDVDHSNPEVASIIAHAKSGETVLAFDEAIVNTEPGREPLLYIPENAVVQETTLVDTVSTGGVTFTSVGSTPNADEKPSTFGSLTALMVRVTDMNGKVNDRNTTVLHENMFQGTSLATQTEACSYGQLTIEPFEGTMPSGLEITGGVVELFADRFDIEDGDGTGGVSGPIFEAARNAFGDGYRQKVDLMLFCLPSTGRFIAFAYTGRGFSWYAGSMCASTTAQLHEVGHNYGLGHSGSIDSSGKERKYGDKTGVMGTSSGQENTKTCYNPHKSWFLGWYQDQNASIDPLDGTGTREILLNGVDDYGTNGDATILLRLTTPESQENDYYVGFNYVEGINSSSRSDDTNDKITVAYAKKDSPGQSWRVAALRPGDYHEIDDFDGSGSTVTVVYTGRTDEANPTVQIIDGPMPPKNEDDCGSTVTVAIKTDNFPADVSWYIYEVGSGNHIASQSSFDKDDKFIEFNTTVCMPSKAEDQEYVFEIYDKYGDGLCCSQGRQGNGFAVYDDLGNVWVDKLGVKYKYKESFHSIVVPGSSTTEPPNTASPSESPSASPIASPSDAPSSAPTVSESDAPTVSESDAPTVSESDAPTVSESDAPTVSESNSPTVSESNSPTVSQSNAPTLSPTVFDDNDDCQDRSDLEFKNKKKKNCVWVGKNTGKRCKKKWKGETLFDWCPVTCDSCPTLGCGDGDLSYDNGGDDLKDCLWVASAFTTKRCARTLNDETGDLISSVCKKTCGTC